jgi:predicted dehydrogenase
MYTWYTRVTGTDGTIIWDYAKGTTVCTRFDGSSEKYRVPSDFNRDTLFINQMQHWLAVVKGVAEPVVPISQGVAVTTIAVAAKKFSEEMRLKENG